MPSKHDELLVAVEQLVEDLDMRIKAFSKTYIRDQFAEVPESPPSTGGRATETDEIRVTEEDDTRITEDQD